jgi:hypothetical protein
MATLFIIAAEEEGNVIIVPSGLINLASIFSAPMDSFPAVIPF